MTEALGRLAAEHGIATEYFDIWGQVHHPPPETLSALLGAMGVAAGDDAQAEAALAALDVQRRLEVLPPVHVLRHGARGVRLQLPEALAGETLDTRIVEENGAEHHGSLVAASLQPGERTVLNGIPRFATTFPVDVALPPGYHHLSITRGGERLGECVLIAAPDRCYRPRALDEGHRAWGAAVQLYAVRSQRNWGIGDFTDLATLARQWSAGGAAVVGLNPLHAQNPLAPAEASPYYPSSRLFLNALYIDVEAVPEFAECEAARNLVASAAFQARLGQLRAATQVDYAGVAEAKAEVLALLAAHFHARHLARGTARAAAFHAFVTAGGRPLREHATHDALLEHFRREDPGLWGWPVWPEPYRRPGTPAVLAFAAAQPEAVDRGLYLQWLADEQLAAAAKAGREAGLAIGLYRDLAVSIAGSGAEAWSSGPVYAVAASVGAPPDAFSPQGQDWGLPPLVPDALRRAAYAPFIATLRANMRHAGALRIDHVMGLARLFWIPRGGKPADGTYVHYPLDDLMAVLALESHRAKCLVIGEDLGTVPDEVRRALAGHDVLSYRLLWFERDHHGDFLPPGAYPGQALVTVTTHDLPTIVGWWEGRDIDARERLGLFAHPDAAGHERGARAHDRHRLMRALEGAGLAPPGWHAGMPAPEVMSPDLACRMQVFLARSPARLLVVQLEDVLGVAEQVNLPGTTVAYPNWRNRLPVPLEDIPGDPRFLALAAALREARPPA